MTTLVLLVITGVTYAVSVGGLALTLGGAWGWAVAALGAVIPGGYLLARAADDRSVERDQRAHRGEQWRPPPASDAAPDPIPPMPAQHD